MVTPFVLVVIATTGWSDGDISRESYTPQPMVPGLTQQECQAIVDRSVPYRSEYDTGTGTSWWVATHFECWPETAK
jgi:hypothetical protein